MMTYTILIIYDETSPYLSIKRAWCFVGVKPAWRSQAFSLPVGRLRPKVDAFCCSLRAWSASVFPYERPERPGAASLSWWLAVADLAMSNGRKTRTTGHDLSGNE